MTRLLSYANALKEAQEYCLEEYPETLLMGLGAPDPKGIFGSTIGLQDKFGKDRVFDIPLSENAITGVALGASITGMRTILTHQRIDFSLVSIEQIVNQSAKWYYMFDGKMKAPIVIRMIIGRGWGQGPQHSQSLQSWFAHIPGLKVIMPTTAYDAKGMLISAIEDDNPVLCLEHRWLYEIQDHVPKHGYRVELNKSNILREGNDLTIIGVSYMTLECLKAASLLKEKGISAEVIDLRSIKPIDVEKIVNSIKKTRNVVIVDTAHLSCGISSEISSIITENCFEYLDQAPKRIGLPDYPTPTSHYLSKEYYPSVETITNCCGEMIKPNNKIFFNETTNINHDQPNASFIGPF